MDRRIETRVVDTGHAAMGVLIQKNACEIWWITVSPKEVNNQGIVWIYDGYDTGGKLEWRIEAAYARHCNFIPPIPCDQGIYVYSDKQIESYTIAWRPKSWPTKVA